MAWVYILADQMLWSVQPEPGFSWPSSRSSCLVMGVLAEIGNGGYYDTQAAFILNALILIYVMLPGTKRAFGMDKPQAM
jgi:hypothetical protein